MKHTPLILALIALNLADLALTAAFITHYNATEINPFADWVMRKWGFAGLAWCKVVALVIIFSIAAIPQLRTQVLSYAVVIMSLLIIWVGGHGSWIAITAH